MNSHPVLLSHCWSQLP